MIVKGFFRLIFSLSWILAPFFTYGQIHDKYIHKSSFTFSSASTYLDNHLYYNVAGNLSWDVLSYEQWLFKSDLSLNAVDSIELFDELNIDSTHFAEFIRLKRTNNSLVLIINEFIPDTVGTNQFTFRGHFVQVSSDLTIIDHVIIEDSDHMGVHLSDAAKPGSDWVLSGWVTTDTSYAPLIVSIKPGSTNPDLHLYPDSIFYRDEILANIEWVDSVFLASISTPLGSTTDRIVVLDSNLSIVGLTDMHDPSGEPVYFPNPGFFINRPPQPPIFLSSAVGDYSFGQNYPYMIMGAGIMNNNYSFVRIDTFAFSGKNSTSPSGPINPKPTISACDFLTPDSCLMVMPGQEMIYTFGYGDRFANDVHMYNYNGVNENLNWHKVYNNGYTQSSFSPVTALPNNQYLVILNEYNWDKYPYDNLSIHLMILNSNGVLINTEERLHHREALRVFPNPCRDRVWVENLEPAIGGSYSYELVSISGGVVEQGEVLRNGEIVFKRQFSGVHLLRLFMEGDLIQSLLLKGG